MPPAQESVPFTSASGTTRGTASGSAPGTLLRVALDVPLRRLFDYRPPVGSTAREGMRVRVPFGRQRLVGLVMETGCGSDVPEARLKAALEALDAAPLIDALGLALLRWAADYYHHPVGQAVAAALPRALRQGAAAVPVEERWAATPDGLEAFRRGEPGRAPQQRRLLGMLAERGDVSAATLARAHPGWREAARALARRGWA
ncbi:MAG: hypothetical protein ACREU3_15535, partial [Steroidobacteraceae bacterium]